MIHTARYYISIQTAPHEPRTRPAGWWSDYLPEARAMARRAADQWRGVRLIDSETGRNVNYACKYTCKGPVRGWCGRYHRTENGARACRDADDRKCARAGNGCYSDRIVVEVP